MAKPAKHSQTKVTRITASEPKETKPVSSKDKKPTKKLVVTETTESAPKKPSRNLRVKRPTNPLAPFWRYIKGSWYELRQVRWPDRHATWKMTGALIAFTLFFVIIILLLDAGFNQLFKLLIGK